jgi:hypothetical protein
VKRSQVVTIGTVGALAAAFSAGCGDDSSETAYCIDQNEEVVENQYCDNDSNGSYFWFFSSGGYARGQSVAGQSGERISTTNKAALASRNGFGSTGKSTGGSSVGVKTGSSGGGSSGGS